MGPPAKSYELNQVRNAAILMLSWINCWLIIFINCNFGARDAILNAEAI